MELHESAEDYLEAIHILKEKQGYVRSVDIASFLGVSKPSVSYATRKLKDSNYIEMDANGMILLTDEGKKIASHVFSKHKVLTTFFTSIGVKEKQAAKDACKIEHDLSDETFFAIKKFLKIK